MAILLNKTSWQSTMLGRDYQAADFELRSGSSSVKSLVSHIYLDLNFVLDQTALLNLTAITSAIRNLAGSTRLLLN